MKGMQTGALLLAVLVAISAQAETFTCAVVASPPSKETPSCANTASCNGDAFRWSSRQNCEITCMSEVAGSPGEMVDVGSATCQKTADNGEPDCGGWPCI